MAVTTLISEFVSFSLSFLTFSKWVIGKVYFFDGIQPDVKSPFALNLLKSVNIDVDILPGYPRERLTGPLL